MANNFQTLRRFERFVFKGVPEAPEPNYQRELNSNVPDRFTGKSQLVDNQDPEADTGSTIIANISYYIDQEVVEVERAF